MKTVRWCNTHDEHEFRKGSRYCWIAAGLSTANNCEFVSFYLSPSDTPLATISLADIYKEINRRDKALRTHTREGW